MMSFKYLFGAILLFSVSAVQAQSNMQADSLDVPAAFVTNAAELLKGRVAGVDVISSVACPGLDPVVYIRGVNALSESKPLYIVDGMRMSSLNGIAPEDIQSIEAIKDATALTLYGPDAADGVIIVRTRRPSTPGFRVSYDAQGLFQWPAWAMKSITREEYAKYMGSPLDDSLSIPSLDDGTERSFTHRHHLDIQYGGHKFNVRSGFSYLDQDGPLRGKEGYRRFTGSTVISWNPLQWLSIEGMANYGQSIKSEDFTHQWERMQEISFDYNDSTYTYYERYSSSYLATAARVEARPLPGLILRVGGGYEKNQTLHGGALWSSWDTSNGIQDKLSYKGNRQDVLHSQLNAEARYDLQLRGGHRIGVSANGRLRTEGLNHIYLDGEITPISDSGFPWGDIVGLIDDIIVPGLDQVDNTNYDGRKKIIYTWKWKELSESLSYSWKDMAKIELGRYDTFVSGEWRNKAQSSWSISASANMAAAFRKSLPSWASVLNLHASWGKTDRILFSGADSNLSTLLHIEDAVDATRKDIGIEAVVYPGPAALGDISFSVTRFANNDEGRMYSPLGGGVIPTDYSIQNKGWEFSVGLKAKVRQLRYSLNANLTLYSNHFHIPGRNIISWSGSAQIVDGYPLGVRYLYKYNSKNFDGNGNYTIPNNELNSQAWRGGAMPKYSVGVRGMLGWKKLSLSISGHGIGGNRIYADHNHIFRYYNEHYQIDFNHSHTYLFRTTATLFKGNFFRIDQIRTDYEISSFLRLYASLDNYFLFTKYPGTDPEMALHPDRLGEEKPIHPTSKRVLFGMIISL